MGATPHALDLSDRAAAHRLVEAILETDGRLDVLALAAGGVRGQVGRPIEEVSEEDWRVLFGANVDGAFWLAQAAAPAMKRGGFGRIVNITSSAVKAPIDILGLSNGARSGLTGFIAGLSRTTVSANVTINNLLPGRFLTDRLRSNFAAEARNKGITPEEAAEAARRSIPAQRFGDEMEFGQYCAWLCSQQASYVTGQNLLIDGGNYPGTF